LREDLKEIIERQRASALLDENAGLLFVPQAPAECLQQLRAA
jgi:hypothetical protein